MYAQLMCVLLYFSTKIHEVTQRHSTGFTGLPFNSFRKLSCSHCKHCLGFLRAPSSSWMRISKNLLHPPNLSIFEPYFDSVRVMRRFRQNVADHAARSASCALVLLQDNLNRDSGTNIFSVLTIHKFNVSVRWSKSFLASF